MENQVAKRARGMQFYLYPKTDTRPYWYAGESLAEAQSCRNQMVRPVSAPENRNSMAKTCPREVLAASDTWFCELDGYDVKASVEDKSCSVRGAASDADF